MEREDGFLLAEKLERAERFIEVLKKSHEKEVTALKDTIENFNNQFEPIHDKYESIIKKQTALLESQKMMIETTTRENLELRSELLKKEDKFLSIQLEELDKNQRKKPSRSTHSKDEIVHAFEQAENVEKSLRTKLAKAEIELVEKSNMLRDATSKMGMLERKCSNLQREVDVMSKSHAKCVTSMKSRNELLENRCERMDERRKTDNAGYRSEVKELRSLLKNLQGNVNLIIKNYGDPELDKKGFEKPDDSLLDQILREGTGVIRHRSKERLGSAVSSANPITTQKALSIWTEYIEKRIDELEEDLDPKLQVLYRNKRNWVSSTESLDSEFKLRIQQDL
ncbi:unnamed protein product [Orchesella dallaii]|uniref:Uncharacterized protein n=1 Tax=Orchesella dallaii TaxID=48710 RepID=A0ABP1PL96_9HEXA